MFDAKFISGFHGLYVVIQQTLVLYRVEYEQTLYLRLCCQGVLHLISRKFKPQKEEGSAELNALKQLKRAEVPIIERIMSHHIMWVTDCRVYTTQLANAWNAAYKLCCRMPPRPHLKWTLGTLLAHHT